MPEEQNVDNVTTPTPTEPPAPRLGDVDNGTPINLLDHVRPEDRTATDWSKFKTLGDALHSLAEGEKYRGASVRLPAADATQEEWDKYYARLRPEQPAKYEINYPDHGGTYEWDDRDKTWVKDVAYRHGLHPRQAQAIADELSKYQLDVHREVATQNEEALREIRNSYGSDYNRNVALANRALMRLGGQEGLEFVTQTNAFANPVFVKMAFELGRMLAQDGTIVGEVQGAVSPDDAQRKLNEIYADRNHALFHRDHVDHANALKDVERLHRIITGE